MKVIEIVKTLVHPILLLGSNLTAAAAYTHPRPTMYACMHACVRGRRHTHTHTHTRGSALQSRPSGALASSSLVRFGGPGVPSDVKHGSRPQRSTTLTLSLSPSRESALLLSVDG
eukprot:GHVU01083783.1.p1 GENE.GHVU01083783.1~~GHVU01083783.1.p1  ORF type:complete len:115 (+),score=9.84 GHVU01083783.1:1014-1358(+)